jgi:hypothetical protein
MCNEENFWKKVNKLGENDCWNWLEYKGPDGYGVCKLNGITKRSHRVAYELCIGTIPEGFYICHICDNPACCNPKHLFAGTQYENMKDMAKKGRADRTKKAKGEKVCGAKLTEKDVIIIRSLYPNLTYKQIADTYKVSRHCISAIITRETWKHIT